MKIWLYYAKSGGGHRAPAEALARDFKKLYPEAETKMVDMAEKASVFFRETIEAGYILLTHRLPWLYAFIYTINNNKTVIKIECFLSDLFVKPAIKAQLVVDSPDAIVATHFLISPLKAALKELNKQIPIFVIVTDPFSVSPVWFYHKDVQYIVYSDVAKKIAIDCGVPASNVTVFHQVVNHEPVILNDDKKKEVRNKYGLDKNKKLVLIIGGANGLPDGEKTFEKLIGCGEDFQVVAVLGANCKQESSFRKIAEKKSGAKVFGWVDDPIEIMSVADLIISKAGAGVVWEALLLKKPLLIAHYIFGQEQGTMEYVVKNNLGWHLEEPKAIAEKVKSAFQAGEIANIIKKNESLGLRPGNRDIAYHIYRTVADTKA